MGFSTRILIAEDDLDDIFLIRSAFDDSSIRNFIDWVPDGVELMKFLRKEEVYKESTLPDLILLDLNMPRKSGMEALKEIKSDFDLKVIPLVVLSNCAEETEIKKCYDLGASSYIIKPTNSETLNSIVKGIELFWLKTANFLTRPL